MHHWYPCTTPYTYLIQSGCSFVSFNHQFCRLWLLKKTFVLVHGLVVSVVLLTMLNFDGTDSFLSMSTAGQVKNGWVSASAADIRLIGDSWSILCRRSIASNGNWFFICESSFLNLFLSISYSVNPCLTPWLMRSLEASISLSSSWQGSPIYSIITLANAFESPTLNRFSFLSKKFISNLRKMTPADQMSILVS